MTEESRSTPKFFWHRLEEIAGAALERGGDPLFVEVRMQGSQSSTTYYVMGVSAEHAEFGRPVMATPGGRGGNDPRTRQRERVWGPPERIEGRKLVRKELVMEVDILHPADRDALAAAGYAPKGSASEADAKAAEEEEDWTEV